VNNNVAGIQMDSYHSGKLSSLLKMRPVSSLNSSSLSFQYLILSFC